VSETSVGMISLGCAKNLVDAEIMLGALRSEGYAITADPAKADVLIVNTCGFIDAAKEESIDAVLEAHRMRGLRRGSGQRLIVAGCLSQRYRQELPALLPEADAFIGLDQVREIPQIVSAVLAGEAVPHIAPRPRYIPDWDTPRVRLTPPHYAYLKIAEGCNHPCSFCVIPQMRGAHRSRSIESVVQEARGLVAAGVREINLISQDTTYFGMDRWTQKATPRQPVDSARGDSLIQLLQALDAIEGDFWIRILYTHPAHWSDELIACIASCSKVAKYIDMPLQHIHGEMLRQMKRETSEEHILNLLARMRQGIPGLAIRTTFIVGFPGEKKEHFERLLEFVTEARFERLGLFEYSREEGSRAARMEGQVRADVKHRRWEKAMQLQQTLSAQIQSACIGSQRRILVERSGVARSEHDAPDIDGRVYCDPSLPVGQFALVPIIGSTDYDLLAPKGRAPK